MSINSRNGNTLLETGVFPPVRAATTAAITLSGLQTVDGIALAEADRVLVKDNTDETTNGIYAAGSGNWVRTSDAASTTQFFSGMAVNVGPGGTVNAGQTFLCTCADDPVIIGTSLLTFESQSAVQAAQQSATSATSLTVGTGTKNFTIESGKSFTANQWVLAYSVSNPANSMLCQIVSYSGTALDTTSIASGGSGTVTDWAIVLTNSAAAAGLQPPVGTGNTTGAASSTTGHLATFADTTGKVLADGGKAGALAGLDTLTPQYLASSAIAFGVGMLNGTIVESHAAGALTVAIKTLAGTDPSATDPVYFLVRDVTAATGDYLVRTVTAALSLTISSGSTLGFANATAGRLWLVAFDDAGTIRLGVINCLSGTSIYPLGGIHLASTSADDGAGGSDSALTFYTANAHALTSKAYHPLGYLTWESGLTTAGTWDASPTRIQLYRAGVTLPGTVLQSARDATGALATGTTALPYDNTIPQNTEGDQYLSQAITPTSAANLLEIQVLAHGTNSANNQFIAALFNDSAANALTVGIVDTGNGNSIRPASISHKMRAPKTSSTTFNVRFGAPSGTTTFNGVAGAGLFGGVINSFLEIKEIMA